MATDRGTQTRLPAARVALSERDPKACETAGAAAGPTPCDGRPDDPASRVHDTPHGSRSENATQLNLESLHGCPRCAGLGVRHGQICRVCEGAGTVPYDPADLSIPFGGATA